MKKWLYVFCFYSSVCGASVEALKSNVSDLLPSLYGWCTKEKALNFIDLVLEVKPDVCVEIGVFGGRSLLPVASALKYLGKGVVIGVDPWNKEESIRYFDPVKDRAHLEWWSKINYDQIYYSCLNLISTHRLEDYVIILKTTSEQAASAIGTIDILYLDGNHSEVASVEDVKLYLPKVRPGGYVWLNDSLWGDLQSAGDLIFDECDFIKLIDCGNCILFKKRNR